MSFRTLPYILHLLPAVALTIGSVACGADTDFVAAHAKRFALNPKGLSFTVEVVGQRTEFRVGEPIPIDVVYRFDESDSFRINGYLNPRSHSWVEIFHVSPESGTRSMSMTTLAAYGSVGTSPQPAMAGKDYRFRAYLNDWRRFDKPGQYHIYDESARAWKAKEKGSSNSENDLRLVSNLVEIKVTPASVEWQNEQIHKAVQILDRPVDQASNNESQRLEALARLRYLDTAAATRELATRYAAGDGDSESYEIGMGLFESNHKSVAVEVLEQRLKSPDFAVSAILVSELARLAAEVQMPREKSPLADTIKPRAQQEEFEVRLYKLEKDLFLKYSRETIEAVASKNPLPRAQTLLEQLPQLLPGEFRNPEPPSPEFLAQTRDAIIPVFNQLTGQEQRSVLGQHWKRLGGKEFLPVLRQFIAAAVETDDSDLTDVLDLVFRRLWELSPDEGTSLILQEIHRPNSRVTIGTYRLLPDRLMPELDEILLKRLRAPVGETDKDQILTARIAARHASPAIYDEVRKVYRRHRHYWGPRPAAMLAYLIRHSPNGGMSILKRALNSTNENLAHVALSDIADAHMSPQLERAAIDLLNDPNLVTVKRVASLLGQRGSAAAEQELWSRLEKSYATWNGRESELSADAESAEQSLVSGIAHSDQWITDPEKLRRLRKLCVAKSGQQVVDRLLSAWREPVEIHFQPGLDGEFYSADSRSGSHRTPIEDYWWVAGQYHARSLTKLQTLLARLPSGITFNFPTGMLSDAATEQKLFDELQQSMKVNGQILLKKPRAE
jgi:hypothetical protein